MKKALNFLSTISLTFSVALVPVACSNPSILTTVYDTDFNKAFGFVFSTENSENTEVAFSMIPSLEAKTNYVDVNQTNQNSLIVNLDKLEINTQYLKLNCKTYNCNSVNSFTGKLLTKHDYNIDDEDKVLVQYAFDDLASWFSIQPEETADAFYDFREIKLEINYQENFYYFDKFEDSENLILWSQQPSLVIFNSGKRIENNFTFFDKKVNLDLKLLDFLLGVSSSISEVVDPNDETKILNQLNLVFDKVEDVVVLSEINLIKNLLRYFQNDLNFEEVDPTLEEIVTPSPEIYDTTESTKVARNFLTPNLSKFNIGTKIIDQIYASVKLNNEIPEKGFK